MSALNRKGLHWGVWLSAAFFFAAQALHAAPPSQTLAALDGALALLDTSDVNVEYTTTTIAVIGDGSGKKLQTIETSERVTLKPGEKPVRQELYKKSSGEKVDAATGASKKDGNGTSSWKFILPTGKDRASYVWSENRTEGSLVSSAFSPAKGLSSQDGMMQGTLYWDASTGYPIRLEMVPSKNPAFTSGLTVSMEFLVLGGFTYPGTIEISLEAGFLFFRRKINSVSRITNLVVEN